MLPVGMGTAWTFDGVSAFLAGTALNASSVSISSPGQVPRAAWDPESAECRSEAAQASS